MPTIEQPMGWPDFAVLPQTSTYLVLVPDGDTGYEAIPVPGGKLYSPDRPGPVPVADDAHQHLALQMAWRISQLEQYKNYWVAVWVDFVPYAWCPMAFRNGRNQTRAYYHSDSGGGWTADEIEFMFSPEEPNPAKDHWGPSRCESAGVPSDSSPPIA